MVNLMISQRGIQNKPFLFFSAITGFEVSLLLPQDCKKAAKFQMKHKCLRHIIFTAETHNFPTG